MIIKFYEVVLSRLRNEIKNYTSRVATGSLQTFDDYRWMCGKIKGLQEAEVIFCDAFDSIQENPTIDIK